MKKMVTVDGNEACATTAYLFTEVSGIYPITPSSPMAEHLDEWSAKGKTNLFHDKVKIVEMQSEAGAAGMVHGSLQSGLLTTTFTASQGLLLMVPNMYKMAGEMLPAVIHVAARSLSTHALSIFGDHQDIYATRMTGFCMLASSSVQDTTYLAAVAHLSAIESSLPFLHFFDGFRTSHEIDKIEMLEKEDYEDMIPYESLKKFRNRALNPLKPVIRGTAQNDDIYFQGVESKNQFYNNTPDIVEKYMDLINDRADTNYKLFNYYGSKTAKKIIVAMGSVCETIKETIDDLKGDIGLIEVHLYRPFSIKHLKKILPDTVLKMAVLDRTKEPGSVGEPLYQDIVTALQGLDIQIVGGRYGLSSKNTTPADIKSVFDMLENNPRHNFTIGIDDDITKLSLKRDDYKINLHHEFLIYGYGSDGMVSAGKSLMKLVGDNTNKYVQGYFEYDSKKSGGVTIGHLRFSNQPIRSTYYVENPRVIAITKDSYFSSFDMISHLQEDGVIVVNTSLSQEEFIDMLPNDQINFLCDKNITVYTINAEELSNKLGLGNKISMIMEMAIIKVSNILNYEFSKKELKKYIQNKFYKKGEKIVQANEASLDLVEDYLKEVSIRRKPEKLMEEESLDIFDQMRKRRGNFLPTSSFVDSADGTFECGTADLEKRSISEIVPKWIKSNCIECGQCSFVCPHGVIRTFLLSEEEYQNAPDMIKKRCLNTILVGLEKYYFIIGISVEDCTGCGLCIKTCPGKRGEKALITSKLKESLKESEQEVFDYLTKNIKEKIEIDKNKIIGSQLVQPDFAFSGACAGCGEPAYIKLLTQLFKDHLIIANATGCSSIYGASAPSMPYKLPWASSLFEDNAEYGYGMIIANNVMRKRLYYAMKKIENNPNQEWITQWLNHMNDYEITKQVYNHLDYSNLPEEIVDLKDYLIKRSIWTIGGDGWAYDIGFSGIDHVLASNDNINILVLDTQVYSNTGGQASKASPKGSIASFATDGKKTSKKDLARIALSYPHVYVATVSLGANMMQLIRVFKEAEAYQGPSIVIAYAPCISHGIEGGMQNSLEMEKLAVTSGYFPLFHYHPETEKFTLDSKRIDFGLYEEFLKKQTRYKMLYIINPMKAEELLSENKKEAMKRYEYYLKLDQNV